MDILMHENILSNVSTHYLAFFKVSQNIFFWLNRRSDIEGSDDGAMALRRRLQILQICFYFRVFPSAAGSRKIFAGQRSSRRRYRSLVPSILTLVSNPHAINLKTHSVSNIVCTFCDVDTVSLESTTDHCRYSFPGEICDRITSPTGTAPVRQKKYQIFHCRQQGDERLLASSLNN